MEQFCGVQPFLWLWYNSLWSLFKISNFQKFQMSPSFQRKKLKQAPFFSKPAHLHWNKEKYTHINGYQRFFIYFKVLFRLNCLSPWHVINKVNPCGFRIVFIRLSESWWCHLMNSKKTFNERRIFAVCRLLHLRASFEFLIMFWPRRKRCWTTGKQNYTRGKHKAWWYRKLLWLQVIQKPKWPRVSLSNKSRWKIFETVIINNVILKLTPQ